MSEEIYWEGKWVELTPELEDKIKKIMGSVAANIIERKRKKMKFTIDREKWLRGESPSVSRLLRSIDRKMCCLGFAALASGYTENDIRDKTGPSEVREDRIEVLADDIFELLTFNIDGPVGFRHVGNNAVCKSMMDANDRKFNADGQPMTDVERESTLKNLFSSIGVEIDFIN